MNANLEPLGNRRRVPTADYGQGGVNAAAPIELQPSKFVGMFLAHIYSFIFNFICLDAQGRAIARQTVSGACTKCGFIGHLPFQCRNTLPLLVSGSASNPITLSPAKRRSLDRDYETPLQKIGQFFKQTFSMCTALADRKAKKKAEKAEKKAKKELKRLQKQQKKAAKHRHRRSTSSSSAGSSSDDERGKRKHKKLKKSKSSKRRRRDSSCSNDSN